MFSVCSWLMWTHVQREAARAFLLNLTSNLGIHGAAAKPDGNAAQNHAGS